MRSNFGCKRAQATLRHLLKSGVAGLPRKTGHTRKWGCRRSGKERICTWYRHGALRRLRFRAATAKTIGNGTPNPQPSRSPAPVDPVGHCVDVWNADGLNLAMYGVHFYADHHIREAWVFTIPNPAYPSVLRCKVVFVVPVDDPYPQEFGTDGEALNPSGSGWQIMPKDVTTQNAAHQFVNATLASDGTLQRK